MNRIVLQYRIVRAGPTLPGIAALLAASEVHAHALYPPESVHMLDVTELTRPHVRFLAVVCGEGIAKGCGALVLDPVSHTGELKRMFVAPSARGLGLGAMLLGGLEAEARAEDLRAIRLETGIDQPEALGLYGRFGYRRRDPFGDYRPDPLSVFLEKRLLPDAEGNGG
ncbi:GNAT family N-acetyltransferase [Stappia indica]|uniref:GNAT family N-acetyltransferase n=1 Tax=Stappia indica TaxID=538381 RepID=UPI001CD1A53F|nr:GNAT family N-acetyltransferase [Stappia indica]MCA1297587.1 GNAT family N-acetyltransferase [Stappia indica]